MCVLCVVRFCFFFFKQKTAYEMRISDWSSDVCSSDLSPAGCRSRQHNPEAHADGGGFLRKPPLQALGPARRSTMASTIRTRRCPNALTIAVFCPSRYEEHTSELQSLMRISYSVFCLNKKTSTR